MTECKVYRDERIGGGWQVERYERPLGVVGRWDLVGRWVFAADGTWLQRVSFGRIEGLESDR